MAPARTRVVVVGAGIFGGLTALELVRRGAYVTLLDAWGPANARASSGGETRILRAIYGPERVFTEMAARALRRWRDHEVRWKKHLFVTTGALWLLGESSEYATGALPFLKEHGLPYEELTVTEARRRYPVIDFAGVDGVVFEKWAGTLRAHDACDAVVEAFVREGGEYRQATVRPGLISHGLMDGVTVGESYLVAADAFVFACGPWLPGLFPDVIGNFIRVTRQEVFTLGTPAGDARFLERTLPIWIDLGKRFLYGVPGASGHGFKIGDDTRGEPFDPTSSDRVPSYEGLAPLREFLARRFPALADAPVLEAHVCQYESTPDLRFLLDRHPGAENVWLVGGGSGHGFKHGPVVGEMAAEMVLGTRPVERMFSLAR